MNAAFVALLLCSRGAQFNLLSQGDGSAPDLPRYIAGHSKKVEWVFLCAGRVDLVWRDLMAQHISFMIVPWLLWPSKAVKDPEFLKVIVPKGDGDKSPPWDGVAVDRQQLAKARKIFSRYISANHNFKLISTIDHTCTVFPAPSDREMLDKFYGHRPDFESIARMAKAFG